MNSQQLLLLLQHGHHRLFLQQRVRDEQGLRKLQMSDFRFFSILRVQQTVDVGPLETAPRLTADWFRHCASLTQRRQSEELLRPVQERHTGCSRSGVL